MVDNIPEQFYFQKKNHQQCQFLLGIIKSKVLRKDNKK